MDDIIAQARHEKCIAHVEEFFMTTCMELVSSDRLDDAEALKGEFVVAEYLVGIDVGGTFTDFVSYNKEGKIIEVWKNPSTPKDPNDGILNGLQRFQNPNEIDNISGCMLYIFLSLSNF